MRAWMAIPVACCASALACASAGAATLPVTTNADTGGGSLRAAVATANGQTSNDEIVFDASLAGQTITLASPLAITKTAGSLVINPASAVTAGVTVSGADTVALLDLTGAAPVTVTA
jgi:hypothetical protein